MTNGYQSVFNLSKLLQRDPTSLTVSDGFFNNGVSSVSITNNQELKRIEIGNECFGKVREFELNGLSELESVVIGYHSFRINLFERNDGSYRIVNCPKLKSIQIGEQSFYDYHSFELNNLPSLLSIDVGEYGCRYVRSFSLTGLIDGLV